MNTIFLQVNGVLTNREGALDDNKLSYLKEMVDNTNSNIVIETIRGFKKVNNKYIPNNINTERLIEKFYDYDLDIYDVIEVDSKDHREQNIMKWLRNNYANNYVILDNDFSKYPILRDKLVCTSVDTNNNVISKREIEGLNENDVKEVIDRINRGYELHK